LIGLPVGAPGLPPRAVHAIPGAARRGAARGLIATARRRSARGWSSCRARARASKLALAPVVPAGRYDRPVGFTLMDRRCPPAPACRVSSLVPADAGVRAVGVDRDVPSDDGRRAKIGSVPSCIYGSMIGRSGKGAHTAPSSYYSCGSVAGW